MAERRRSPEDQKKMLRDFLNDCSSKGADFKEAWITSPGGTPEAIRSMKKDVPYVIAQSQLQTEQNKEKIHKKEA